MKKLFLLLAVAIATLMNASAQNLITDGTFETTPVGSFTLTSSVGSTRSVWGGINKDPGSPVIGVATGVGGASGNCGVYTRGTTTPTWQSLVLYQRLPSTAGLMSPSKKYKLTMKLKSGSTPSNGYFYIKHASTTKFAVREDYSTGQTYAWRLGIESIPDTWTVYSQYFIFSNSITSATQSTTPSGTAFTQAEMDNIYIGFYSTTEGGTVYVDDVVFEEDTTTGLSPVKKSDNFIVVNNRQISINDYNGESVSVYNATGQLVLKTNKAIFDLDGSGLYIVKMGNKTQRVIVK